MYSFFSIVPQRIDDIYVCVTNEAIDGEFNIIGYGGPNRLRGSFPFEASMTIDVADLDRLRQNNGRKYIAIIEHELGHCLGLGVLWNRFDLAIQDQDDPSICNYTGENANREWRQLSGCDSTVPVPYESASGCMHWDETCLNAESMTPFVEADGSTNKVSKITLGALEDIGYTVDYSQGEDFTSDDIPESCKCTTRRLGQGSTTSTTYTNNNTVQSKRKSRYLGDDGHRHPSQEAEDNAIAFGLEILRERKEELLTQTEDDLLEDDSIITVSHEVLGVVFIEDDQLFSVEVSSASIE